MKRVLLWQLPVVDVFAMNKILEYYKSIGVLVPTKHHKAGMIERWVGYLPVGIVMGKLTGLPVASLCMSLVFAFIGPLELYLMLKGKRPWSFFRGKNPAAVKKIFLIEGYNAVGYYILGALLGAIV
jgi:hypothetical protein